MPVPLAHRVVRVACYPSHGATRWCVTAFGYACPTFRCCSEPVQKLMRVREDRDSPEVESLIELADSVRALIKGMYAPKKSMDAAIASEDVELVGTLGALWVCVVRK